MNWIFEHFEISRGSLLNALISAGYFALAGLPGYIYIRYPLSGMMPLYIALGIIVLGAFCAWIMAARRYRMVIDTPTSQVRSAPQGYVELVGTCELIEGSRTLTCSGLPPCVWYRVKMIYRMTWCTLRKVSYNYSNENFLLVDDSGQCVIDPDHAEVMLSHKRSWATGDGRCEARYILPGDTLYAMGEFESQRFGLDISDRSDDIAAKLSAWKVDKQALLRRFDAARDGKLSAREWDDARQAAADEVDAEYREMRDNPELHVMHAPRDGRPFLLANRDPRSLIKRYRYWAWFHLVVFITSAGAALTILGYGVD